MIIYNLAIKIEKDTAEAYVNWLKQEHIPALMETGLFLDYRMSRLLEQDDNEGPTYIVQYFCDSIAQYNEYIEVHAQRLREKGTQRFGAKFIAFRTLMEVEPR
jgi:hypothetical protein